MQIFYDQFRWFSPAATIAELVEAGHKIRRDLVIHSLLRDRVCPTPPVLPIGPEVDSRVRLPTADEFATCEKYGKMKITKLKPIYTKDLSPGRDIDRPRSDRLYHGGTSDDV